MEKAKLVQAIVDLHNRMWDTFHKHGISRELLAFKSKNLEDAEVSQLEYVLGWLKIVEKNEYTKLRETYALHPESHWEFFNFMGGEDMQEQRLLAKCIKDSRKVWEGRPLLLRKDFNAVAKVRKIETPKKKGKKHETQS